VLKKTAKTLNQQLTTLKALHHPCHWLQPLVDEEVYEHQIHSGTMLKFMAEYKTLPL